MNVTLSKGGTAEVTLPIDDVKIPDVWKIVMYLQIPAGPEREELLECWHIAHALKRTLQELD